MTEEIVKTLEELKRRVESLEDLEKIKTLHRNYVYWLCEKKWDMMLQCFVEDAEAEIMGERLKGKREIEKFFKTTLNERVSLKDGHIVAQPVISIEKEKASGHWILYLFFSEPEVRWLQGRQDCEYVKINGEWKIKRMKFAQWPKTQ